MDYEDFWMLAYLVNVHAGKTAEVAAELADLAIAQYKVRFEDGEV